MTDTAIVVVTWNGLAYTRACLESLWWSRVSPSQVIVVDNGSTDGTVEHLEQTGVGVLTNGENLGFARAANRGIRAAPAGCDVVLLNNDVRITEHDWLARLRAVATERPRVGAVAPRLVYPDGRLQDAGVRIAWSPLCVRHYGAGEPDVGQFTTVRPVPAVSFACVYLRREALSAVGLLDEDFFCYFEDLDLCLRLRRAGYAVLCAGETTLIHEENVTAVENRIDHGAIFRGSQAVFETKWPAPPAAPEGELLVLGYPDPEPEAVSVIETVLLGLEDRGWRVSYRNRTAWGSPLDAIDPADDWSSFVRAAQYRVPAEPPKVLLVGSPIAVALEGSAATAGLVAFPGELPPVPSRALEAAWLGVPWPYQAHAMARSTPPEVVPPPLDPHYFFAMDPRRQYRPLTFLTIAPWAARAHPDVLVHAFVKAFGASRDVRLVYAAAGPEPPEEPPAENVETRWLPWPIAAERARLYREADVFLLLGGAETWGLHFLEAVETGLPVVATRSGALLPYLEEECFYPLPRAQAAVHSPPDADALAVMLRSIARSPADASYRAHRGRERMRSLGFTASSVERVSAAIAERARPDGERFPAGHDPAPGPLADRSRMGRPYRVAGPAAQAAARLATLAAAHLHLRADLENHTARLRALEREVAHLRREGAVHEGIRPPRARWLERLGRRALRPLLPR